MASLEITGRFWRYQVKVYLAEIMQSSIGFDASWVGRTGCLNYFNLSHWSSGKIKEPNQVWKWKAVVKVCALPMLAIKYFE